LAHPALPKKSTNPKTTSIEGRAKGSALMTRKTLEKGESRFPMNQAPGRPKATANRVLNRA
jgi:hypothetical protein